MKKISLLWGSLLAVVIILALVAASDTGSKLIYQARHTFRVERFLLNENGNLIFVKQTWGSTPERTLVKKLKKSALTARSTGRQIQISLNRKSFHRSSHVNDIIVSPKNETVFFTEFESIPPSKSGQKLAYPRLYRWTEKGGFEAMNAPGIGTSSPLLSVDEQVLIERNSSGAPVPGGTEIYDIKTKRTSPFKSPPLNYEAVVNANTILTIERDQKSSDDAYGQLIRVDVANAKSEPVLPEQLAGRVMAFDGSIWVLLKTSDSYQVVRLSSDLKQIEETIKVK